MEIEENHAWRRGRRSTDLDYPALGATVVFAAAAVGGFAEVSRQFPVAYTRLVTEDHWVEYGTFAAFLLAGVFLIASALRRGTAFQRVATAIGGLVALTIAGEEISWGQRIFELPTPEFLERANYQGELTLHNIESLYFLTRRVHRVGARMVLALVVASQLVHFLRPAWESWLWRRGIPLVPPQLVPIFLVVPYFLDRSALYKAPEIGELGLGVAAAMWAVHLWLCAGELTPRARGFRWVATQLVLGLAIAGIAHVLTGRVSEWPSRSDLIRSAGNYGHHGMIGQADEVYRYIADCRGCRRPEATVAHARLLHSAGRGAESVALLRNSLGWMIDFVERNPVYAPDNRMHLGIAYSMLGEPDHAEEQFVLAREELRLRLQKTSDPDQRAQILWSAARIHRAQGERDAAFAHADQALGEARSAHLQVYIGHWIRAYSREERLRKEG